MLDSDEEWKKEIRGYQIEIMGIEDRIKKADLDCYKSMSKVIDQNSAEIKLMSESVKDMKAFMDGWKELQGTVATLGKAGKGIIWILTPVIAVLTAILIWFQIGDIHK